MYDRIEFVWRHTRDLIIVLLLVMIYRQLGGAQEVIPYEPAHRAPAVSLKDVGQKCGAAVLATIDSEDGKAKGSIDEDPTRPGLAAFARAGEKMMAVSQHDGRLIIALISSSEINAWSLPHAAAGDLSLVCMPTAMADFIHNEDELAFVIGHEIGHTLDSECKQHLQTVECEMRADAIGYRLLERAGFDGYAAAGYFGRWEMYSGEMQTGLLGSLHQALMDHPITPKRIEHMRKLLLEATKAARTSH